MKLVSYDVKTFRDVFNSIGNIIDEIIIEVNNHIGISVNGLSKDHITFASLDINKAWFDEFYCDEIDKICVDSKELLEVLKRGKSDDTLIIEVNNNDLVIIFDGESKRTFKIRLIDVTYEPARMPKLDYDVDFEIPYKVLKDLVTDTSLYSDKVKLRVNNDNLCVSSDGDFGSVNSNYALDTNFNYDVSSVFNIKRVINLMRCNLNRLVGLKLGNNMPLTLYCEDYTKDIMISFILASTIEREY